jgi:hypothetical protein
MTSIDREGMMSDGKCMECGLPIKDCNELIFERGEVLRLASALATANKLADQYRADYERSVLNGDRLFDKVERLQHHLAKHGGIEKAVSALDEPNALSTDDCLESFQRIQFARKNAARLPRAHWRAYATDS